MFGVPPDQVDPGMRSKAKMINFGIVYGLSAYGLADRLHIPQEEAAEFIERYLGRFPKVKEFIEQTIAQATDDGYVPPSSVACAASPSCAPGSGRPALWASGSR